MSDLKETEKFISIRACPYRKNISKVKSENDEYITVHYSDCIIYNCPFYNNKITCDNPTYCNRVNKEIKGG